MEDSSSPMVSSTLTSYLVAYWCVILHNLVPRPSTPRFYLAAVEKNRGDSCEIKSGRGRPGYEVRYCIVK